MSVDSRTAIVVSASSDIGTAISGRWLALGWDVYGTYRTESEAVRRLRNEGMELEYCDLSDTGSIHDACSTLAERCGQWDVLVMCPGTQDPVGAFADGDFDEWEESLTVNFTSQLRIIHELLPSRRVALPIGPCVLFFAGGGTNSAPVNYSAYTISKIALIKMCEILDAEVSHTSFVIVGPGWVRTKIHESTLVAGARAGANYQRTKDKLNGNELTPMDEVLDCCDWLIDSPRELVGGRNFSVVFDRWGEVELSRKLSEDSNMYKLRRSGNDWTVGS